MSSPIDLNWFIQAITPYLTTRLNNDQLGSLSRLQNTIFTQISLDLDSTISLYNTFPTCLQNSSFSPQLFTNSNHLKTLLSSLPLYSITLNKLSTHKDLLDIALSEMRDSTYFHHIYEINNPSHLLANLMTLVFRCHLLNSQSHLRINKAQVSSTLEEMSTLRFLLGTPSLHFSAIKHWVLDWQGEGFSEDLAKLIQYF